jgi:FixJ family two-component response regulator
MAPFMERRDAVTLAVVDDDDDVRTALDRLLQAMGYRVLGFASAEDFEAHHGDVDCAIVDMRLPGMSGVELCERLRRRSSPTPVVLVTGDAYRPVSDPPAAPGTPLLNKPFDDAALANAIAAAIAGVAACRVD